MVLLLQFCVKSSNLEQCCSFCMTHRKQNTDVYNVCIRRLLGMVLIMVGLYSFLWGKSNEKKGMTQQPIVAAAEVSNVTDLIAGPESTATVVPSSSPLNTITLVSETPYKN